METNLSRYQKDLARLLKESEIIYNDLANEAKGKKGKKGELNPGQLFFEGYQKWYSEAYEVIRQLLPNRLNEFEKLYYGDEKRKSIDAMTYTIQDWLLGVRVSADSSTGLKLYDDAGITFMRFQMQHAILKAASLRFESSLLDIKQLVRAELFDSEVESARELLKNGFGRAAGAVVGVVTEKHLDQVCKNHNVTISNKEPTITIYNDALKNIGVLDTPKWRFIQRIGDLRNYCDHNKNREPTKDEVIELIDSVEKLTKTVF